MLSIHPSRIRFLLFIMMTVALLACAPSSLVQLSYTPISPSGIHNPNSPYINIVLFEDQRSQSEIGSKKNGKPFIPASLVAEWVSHALRDELIQRGLKPLYTSTLSSAMATNPDIIITGIIHELWLEEINHTTYDAKIQVSIQVQRNNTVLFAEKIEASQEFKGLPSSEMATILFENTLQDLLVPTSKKLLSILR